MTPENFHDAVLALAEEVKDLVMLNIDRLVNGSMTPAEVLHRLSSISNNAGVDAEKLLRKAP